MCSSTEQTVMLQVYETFAFLPSFNMIQCHRSSSPGASARLLSDQTDEKREGKKHTFTLNNKEMFSNRLSFCMFSVFPCKLSSHGHLQMGSDPSKLKATNCLSLKSQTAVYLKDYRFTPRF